MRRAAIDKYRGETTLGIDVSHWQGEIDFDAMARSEAFFEGESVGPVRYVIVRTGDGKDLDERAVRNLVAAHEAGFKVAVYHFVRGFHSAELQLDIIFEVLRNAGVPIGFVALDVEGRPDNPRTPDVDESSGLWYRPDRASPVDTAQALGVLERMARALVDAGHRVVLYSGQSWHFYVAQKGLVPAWVEIVTDLWCPWYTRGRDPKVPIGLDGKGAPWPYAKLHQFAGSKKLPGRVEGIAGAVDLNRFRGDEDELERWWGAGARETLPAPAGFDRRRIADLAAEAKEGGDLAAAEGLAVAHEGLAG